MNTRQKFLAILLLPWLTVATSRGADWNIVKAGGRDYIPLSNIANFYSFASVVPPFSQMKQLAPEAPNLRRASLSGSREELEVNANSREIKINGVKHWLSFPTIVQDDQVLVSRLDLSKTIDPALRPQSVGGIEQVKTVVLDPGHGGHDRGATSVYGMEKNFALDVCNRAKKMLEQKGFRVLTTRSDDTFIPLPQRPRLAGDLKNTIFVSIHFNSSNENRSASGFEIFSCTPRGAPSTSDDRLTTRDLRNELGNTNDGESSVLANVIFHSMMGQVPVTDRGIKHARFAVLRLSKVPAVLVECGFVSNALESQMISHGAWRNQVAKAVTDGIAAYNQIAVLGGPPKLMADYRRESSSSVQLRPVEPTILTEKTPEE